MRAVRIGPGVLYTPFENDPVVGELKRAYQPRSRPRKSAAQAVASAAAAVVRARAAGQAAVLASKRKLKPIPGLTALGAPAVAGWAADVRHLARGARQAAPHVIGASPATAALAARRAAVSAALASARQKGNALNELAARASASVDHLSSAAKVHQMAAGVAAERGAAALAAAASAQAAIKQQIDRLKKLGVKTTIVGALDAADMKAAYEHAPGDSVLFPPGKSFDNGAVGSWSMYFGPVGPTGTRLGYAWDGTQWVFVGVTNTNAGPQTNPIPLPNASTQQVSRLSTGGQVPQGGGTALAGGTFGALIGDPNSPDYANLRYAPLDDKWFWLADEAPSYATRERDEALALLAAQEQAANEAADAAAQAAADQAQAEADAALAAMNAKYDLAEAELARQADVQAQQLALEDEKLAHEIEQAEARDELAQRQAGGGDLDEGALNDELLGGRGRRRRR